MDRIDTVEALHRRYAGVLFDKCLRMLGNRTDAEDAVQDTFLNAYRALGSFRGESHLPWLFRIATNVCLKQFRTKKRKGLVLMDDPEPLEVPFLPVDPDDAIYARRLLKTLLEEHDERSQEIIVSYFVDGMTQEEIATCLGISRRAVVKRLTKIRARLRALMEEA